MTPFDRSWPLVDAVQLACLYEVTAPKVGNVHPSASFDDMHYGHFASSAIAIRESFALESISSNAGTVGEIVLSAVKATRLRVGCNTNLGTLLLFGPIALAYQNGAATIAELYKEIAVVLASLDASDSQQVYEAIRLAQPGGLGKREKDDVAAPPPAILMEAMQQVADTDAVARQYTTAYADIFERLLPWFAEEQQRAVDPLDAICRLQIRWLAHECDGLIVRKLGTDAALAVKQKALAVWGAVQSHAGKRAAALDEVKCLDRFLRSDGNRLNPGTTADLIAATLLVSLLAS